jgi:hypothetical protein
MTAKTVAQLSTTVPYRFWGATLVHTAGATATLTNGAATVEVARFSVTTSALANGFFLPSPILVTGLAATVSAGTLTVYVD